MTKKLPRKSIRNYWVREIEHHIWSALCFLLKPLVVVVVAVVEVAVAVEVTVVVVVVDETIEVTVVVVAAVLAMVC